MEIAARMVRAFAYSVLLLSLLTATQCAAAVALLLYGSTERSARGGAAPTQACDSSAETPRSRFRTGGPAAGRVGCVRQTVCTHLRSYRHVSCPLVPYPSVPADPVVV